MIGLGNSGADIACDAARFAAQAYVSVRRGYHFVPKHLDAEHVEWRGQRPSHFLSAFSRRHAGLYTLGFVELNGALYPHLDRLSALIAEHAHARAHAPRAAERFRRIVESVRLDLSAGIRYVSSPRHDFYCDDDALRRQTERVFGLAGWTLPSAEAWRPLRS